jgi:hypothetical protein
LDSGAGGGRTQMVVKSAHNLTRMLYLNFESRGQLQ